jgi:hypothetical protein
MSWFCDPLTIWNFLAVCITMLPHLNNIYPLVKKMLTIYLPECWLDIGK